MKIQVSSDHNIKMHEAAITDVKETVEEALVNQSTHVTSVDVHISDENAGKGGAEDKRCMMEVRLAGHQPLVVTCSADTVELAVDGASEKLTHLVEKTLERV